MNRLDKVPLDEARPDFASDSVFGLQSRERGCNEACLVFVIGMAIMSAARWSLRLPRTSRQIPILVTPRVVLPRTEQRSFTYTPSPRKGTRTGKTKGGNQKQNALDRRIIQQNARQLQDAPKQLSQENANPEQHAPEPQQGRNQQLSATLAASDMSDLVSEVHIPHDVDGVLPLQHPALALLGNSSLVIQRQIEMMNVMLGFEQANRYIIMDGQGKTVGYIAERDHGIGSAVARQMFRTHRSFTTHIFDDHEREVLRIHRPFAYINSRIRIYDPIPDGGYQDTDSSSALQGVGASSVLNQSNGAQVSPLKVEEMRIIGEAQQQWAPLRRKYNLFTFRPLAPLLDSNDAPLLASGEQLNTETKALTEAKAPDQAIEAGMSQFALINEPFLSWDFNLRNENQNTVGSVNRNFGGFAREIFTDTGVYVLRMDAAAQTSALESSDGRELATYERDATAMTLDQRAIMLATAVSIDFDYFSRHSHAGGGGGFMPIFWPMGGGTAAEGAGAAGAGAAGGVAAGEAGVIGAGTAMEGATGAAVGTAARGVGVGASESAVVGAGSMAAYGARGGQDGASPQAGTEDAYQTGFPSDQQVQDQQPGGGTQDSPWGNDQDQDPWGGGGSGDGPSPSTGGGDGEGGGGLLDVLSDFFGGD